MANKSELSGFKQLLAWQKGDDLASEIFRITEELDSRHRWLGLQLIKAAASVTANISEGYGRSALADYLRFLEYAGGSLNEVENFLHFAKRNLIVTPKHLQAAEQLRWATSNLLFGLARSLRNKQRTNGNWHRGIKEFAADYAATHSDHDSQFQVPCSMFQNDSSELNAATTDEFLKENHHG